VNKPVTTLAALALIGCTAPAALAVSIKDDVVSITPTVRMQTRAQMNDAKSATGTDYRVNGGTAGAVDESIDFMVRRARFGINFKYGSAWKGRLQFMADNVDNTATNANRGANIRYGWVERGFDLGDGMSAAVKFGLDKAEQNASDRMSSSVKLLPNDNAASTYLAPRGVGVSARFHHPIFWVGADLLNNTNAAKDVTTTNATEEEGFYYGVRGEFSFSPEWMIAKRAESFVNKEGQGLVFGLSYGVNNDAVLLDVDTATAGNQQGKQSLSAYQADVLFWLNGLSALAEFRSGSLESTPNAGTAPADVDAEFITIQLGYAMPVSDMVVEPAIRYQIIDNNTDNDDEASNYGSNAETGGSGTQIDLGVNLYFSGHENKLGLAVSLWEAEEGSGEATIIRLQHQINF
jgi:Phosphate-selective porin O and P